MFEVRFAGNGTLTRDDLGEAVHVSMTRKDRDTYGGFQDQTAHTEVSNER